jgi:antitoxin PrlF
MILSRLTSKAQTTIPAAVRRALGVEEGDYVPHTIEGGRVVLTRAEASGLDPFAAFDEGDGEADRKACAGF